MILAVNVLTSSSGLGIWVLACGSGEPLYLILEQRSALMKYISGRLIRWEVFTVD